VKRIGKVKASFVLVDHLGSKLPIIQRHVPQATNVPAGRADVGGVQVEGRAQDPFVLKEYGLGDLHVLGSNDLIKKCAHPNERLGAGHADWAGQGDHACR